MASEHDKRPGIERRVFNLTNCEVRADGDGPAKFSGYAAVFNELSVNLGGFRERIRPGAFRTAISDGDDVRFLINHDANQILGRTPKTLSLSEDDIGLRVDCDLPNTSYANDLAESMRRGDINQMSFGFTTRDDAWPEKDTESGLPIRELVDVGLFDVSVVAYPAYPDTTAAVREMRSEIAEDHPELLERAAQAAEELPEPEALPESEAEERDEVAETAVEPGHEEYRDTWTDAYINDLPDDAFLYIEPDGEKDGDGKTTPRSKRHFPYKNDSGDVDLPHLRDAIGRIPQSDLPDDVKSEVQAKAEKILADNGGEKNSVDMVAEAEQEVKDYNAAKAREVYDEMRAEAGVRIEDDHPQCDGVAVVWNFNDELQSCHADRAAAEAQVEALTSGAAGAARDAEPEDEAAEADEAAEEAVAEDEDRAGKVLSQQNKDLLTQAHQALSAVLSTAGETDAGFDDMGGSASTEPDESVKDGGGGVYTYASKPELPSLETLRAFVEERGWDYDDDWALYVVSSMASLASCYLSCADGDDDGDGDDEFTPMMSDMLRQLGEAIAKLTADPAGNAPDADAPSVNAMRRRRLELLELEASL